LAGEGKQIAVTCGINNYLGHYGLPSGLAFENHTMALLPSMIGMVPRNADRSLLWLH
jgi:hypothetical protein